MSIWDELAEARHRMAHAAGWIEDADESEAAYPAFIIFSRDGLREFMKTPEAAWPENHPIDIRGNRRPVMGLPWHDAPDATERFSMLTARDAARYTQAMEQAERLRAQAAEQGNSTGRAGSIADARRHYEHAYRFNREARDLLRAALPVSSPAQDAHS